jgi:hypothetical protein
MILLFDMKAACSIIMQLLVPENIPAYALEECN